MAFQVYQIGGPTRTVHPIVGCLPLFLLLILFCILPYVLYDTARSALERIGLSLFGASLTVFGIVVGSFINIPVGRIQKDELELDDSPFDPLEASTAKKYRRVQYDTLVAVNVGGCLIPGLLAIMQVLRILDDDALPFGGLLFVTLVSIAVCWWAARPVEGVGILIPVFIPPLVSVVATWLVLLPLDADPEQRAATAFVAGVLGPIIGADLLHLKSVTKVPVPVVSIGGAGTFDGIVLSGLLAALLA